MKTRKKRKRKTMRWKKNINVTMITGPRGCGKGTLIKLLMLLAKHIILGIETSDALKHYRMTRNTKIARLLRKSIRQQNSGKILKAEIVVRPVFEVLHEMVTDSTIHIVLAGSPRGRKQLREWRRLGVNYRVVHITSDMESTFVGALLRELCEKACRADSNWKSILKAWVEYTKKVKPPIDELALVRPEDVLTLEKSLPLHEKLLQLINFLDTPDAIKAKLLKKFARKNSAVRRRADAIMTAVNGKETGIRKMVRKRLKVEGHC